MLPETDLKHFRHQKNVFWGSRKSIWGPKRPISESHELNLAIWGLFRLEDSLYVPFFWSLAWEMWSEVDLKHFRHQKNIFWGSRKSIWVPKRPISESYEVNLVIWGLFRLGDSLDAPFIWLLVVVLDILQEIPYNFWTNGPMVLKLGQNTSIVCKLKVFELS